MASLSALPHQCYRTQTVGTTIDISLEQDGGVKKKLVKEGCGDDYPYLNDRVEVSYTGYMGEIAQEYIFDSTKNKEGNVFEFDIGRGEVIKGLETAIMTMKRREHAIIYLEPEYAYGRGGNPPKIPRDTPIVFDIELIDFREEDMTFEKDGSIVKKVLKKGTGYSPPNQGCMVSLHIKGQFDDTVFMDKDVVFPYGEGTSTEFGIPGFIEDVLQGIKKEEHARLTVKAERAFGSAGCDKYDVPVPPDKDVVFYVEVNNYERTKDMWEMNNTERMDQCDIYKQKGTLYLQRNELDLAKKFYGLTVEPIENDTCMEGEEEERRKALIVAGNLNLALINSKLGDHKGAKDCCSKVVAIDSKSVKGYFRRGTACFETKDYESAKSDFLKVLELEPTNKAAKSSLVKCEKALAAAGDEEKKLCKTMLSGLGKNSAQMVL